MEWVQLGGGEALLKIIFPNIVLNPMEEFPNSSGFSVGLHTKNWTAWSKSDDYSQPAGSAFALTDKISVYSNGILLNGQAAPNLACPEVWFLEIHTDSVKIGWKPSHNQEQTALELRSFNGASLGVNLTQAADSGGYREWSGAFPVQHENHGELWLNCSGKMAAYFAYGRAPENAGPAVKAGLWEDESGFVKAHTELGYNMGISPGERFIVNPEQFGRRISDWKLYRVWEAPDLPELPTIAFPGLGISIMPETPSDSMLFAWTAVDGFSLYQLNVVRDSAYGDTLHSILVSGTEIRLPMPPPGVYVWWAEPVTRSRFSLTGLAKTIAKAIKYTNPILNSIIGDEITASDFLLPPAATKTPMGVFEIVAKEIELWKKTLGLAPIRARKDTRMLDLGWAKADSSDRENAIDSGWWDSPDTIINRYVREDVKNRCWAIAVQQMNRYFLGNMTQDEIVYHGKSHGRSIEKHFPHEGVDASGWPDIVPTMGYALNLNSQFQYVPILSEISYLSDFFVSAPGWFALPPDPVTVMASIQSGLPLVIIQVNQGFGAAHVMVIDGYKIFADGSIYLHFVGEANEGTEEWRKYAYLQGLGVDVFVNMLKQGIDNLADFHFKSTTGSNFYVAYYIPPAVVVGRMRDSRIYDDSDNDGIVDFDEIERFHTNPNKADTDGDGIPDKMEIAYYTRKGVSADIDGDGLRAELDVDSDGDEDCDGDENANKDYMEDSGEYDMMDPTRHDSTGRQNCKIHPVALLAAEQININDRAYCSDGSNNCPIVSLGRGSGHAVQLGVSAKVGSILAGFSVWLRSNSIVFNSVHSAGPLILQDTTPQILGTRKQNDTVASMLVQVYSPKLSISDIGAISGDIIQIPSGYTLTLEPKKYTQNIVVSSGSVLRLQPGNYQMGNLTVLSGGKIELLGRDSIVLNIAGSFQWDGSLLNSIQEAASRLRVRVQGIQYVFLNTSFGGFIVAPYAHVVVGQADKEYAGQIYARSITLHQDTYFQWIQPGSQQSPESKRSMSIAALNRGNIHVCSNN